GQRVDEGSTVRLKVSAGATAVPVPDVIGSQIADARRLLTGQGFTVLEEPIPDEEIPVGEVVDQEPGPNEEAPRGSQVVLQVSSGPEERPVPDVTGRTLSEASNLLGQNGFVAEQASEASTTVEEGIVIRTDPPANTLQPRGAVVTVVVSSGPPTADVPAVEGLLEANAVAAIQNAGFVAVVERTVACTQPQDGRVLDQTPDGNTRAEVGTQVRVVVCDAPVDGGGGGGGA
ncbi:MAG: PASTA domain-containing protein, partial [Acidimicrobiales bacterium]